MKLTKIPIIKFKGTNESWKKLISGEIDGNGIALKNTTLQNGESLDTENAAGTVSQVMVLYEEIICEHQKSISVA